MYDILSAILAINPSAEVTIDDEDFDRITWLNGTAVISKSDIQAKIVELKAAYDALEYQRQRESEYPEIGDQLDKIYHDGIDAWKADMIKPIKDKYPKE
tara:strand:+ start:634 stop:930 length:297 start_codon:yes stop_codon:yes gene_type:complete